MGPVTRAAGGLSEEIFLTTKPEVVLRGLDPRIHAFVSGVEGVNGRAKPGQEG